MDIAIYQDIMFYIEAGGFVMPPLIVATFVLWYALGYRYATLKRGNERSVRRMLRRYADGLGREPRGILENAVKQALQVRNERQGDIRPYLEDTLWPLEREMKRFATLITAIVAVAPLLGLLGTVVGMIETFESLGDMSLFSQSGGIAGGISQALFTTQMGLAVAIPGLVVAGILNKKESRLKMEFAQIKDLLAGDDHLLQASE